MTNSDRLQEIRERVAAITPRHITANPMQWQQDGIWLLQHITEQQREIARARRTVSNLVGGMCEHKESCQYPQCKCGQPDEAKGYRKQERPM